MKIARPLSRLTSRHFGLLAAAASALLLSACNNTGTTPTPNNEVTATAGPTPPPAIALTLAAQDTRSIGEKVAWLRTLPRQDQAAAAEQLGLSPAEILAADVRKNVIRLRDGGDTAYSILLRLHELGRVRASSRNDFVSISVTGTARPPREIPATEEREARKFPGYFGPPIDLRPSYANWQFAFAQITFTREGQVSRRLHFFDAQGQAVQTLTLDSLNGVGAFEKIVEDFRAETQSPDLQLAAAEPEPAPRADAEVDVPSLIAAWDAITDVHQFSSAVLAKHDVTRLQALRLAGPERAQRLASPAALTALLNAAADQEMEIMAFVSNTANTQIFTGTINEPQQTRGDWISVKDDKGASLLIQPSGIDQIWLVKKPSSSGTLSTVEVYNAKGEVIVQFYSKREPRKPESEAWRELLANLPKAK